MCAPGSSRRSVDDSEWVTRQPVTTISFWGSPGRSSLRRGSSAICRSRPVAERNAWAVPLPSGTTEKVATSTLPGRGPGAQCAADRRRGLQCQACRTAVSAMNSEAAAASCPAARSAGAEVVRVVQQVESRGRSWRPSQCRAHVEAAALVRLSLGAVDFEPAGGAATEAKRAAVVSGAEEDDLARTTAEAAGHLGVDDLRALRQRGGAPDRDAQGAGDVPVEAPLRLDVTAGGRGARALQTESLGRYEACRQRGMSGAAQVGIALAVAGRGWPKRNDR